MKNVNVVAAIICDGDKILLLKEDMESLKMVGNFLVVRLRRENRLKKHL